jgi:hypothetical protein
MQQVVAPAAGHEDQSSEDLRATLSLLSKKLLISLSFILLPTAPQAQWSFFCSLLVSVFGISSSCHPGDKKTQYSAVIVDLRHFGDH